MLGLRFFIVTIVSLLSVLAIINALDGVATAYAAASYPSNYGSILCAAVVSGLLIVALILMLSEPGSSVSISLTMKEYSLTFSTIGFVMGIACL